MANCTEFLLHFPERESSKLWPLYYGLFHYFLVEPENMKTNTKVKKLLKYTFTVYSNINANATERPAKGMASLAIRLGLQCVSSDSNPCPLGYYCWRRGDIMFSRTKRFPNYWFQPRVLEPVNLLVEKPIRFQRISFSKP